VISINTKENKFRELLSENLDFKGINSVYSSHGLHAFAAKFPPQLPRMFIENLTQEGDIVLDPMVGSGTTVVESCLLNRQGIGIDLDPLAVHLSKVKVTPINPEDISIALNEITNSLKYLYLGTNTVRNELNKRFDSETRDFIDYWFLPKTQEELMTLVLVVENLTDETTKNFFKLLFSSIIITKSGGVSLARDLAHTRPHKDKFKKPVNSVDTFINKAQKFICNKNMFFPNGGTSFLMRGDARCIPISPNTVDLIVTSPPYSNAIDYMRAHKFSLIWFGKALSELRELRSKYIGAERASDFKNDGLPPSVVELIDKLININRIKGKILGKYFADMKLVVGEMYRVLKTGACSVIVVGNSKMAGMDVKTHDGICSIAKDIGFKIVKVGIRNLDRDKRMLPAYLRKSNDKGITNRIHEEYIIGLIKE